MSTIPLTYHWLEGDELEILEPILAARGWTSLNGKVARAIGAFDETGKLVGFQVLQLFPMVGPLYVEPLSRGTGIASELTERMRTFLVNAQARGWMVIADAPFTAQLCEAHGMRKVESPVYLA